jgi:hypothetical protein
MIPWSLINTGPVFVVHGGFVGVFDPLLFSEAEGLWMSSCVAHNATQVNSAQSLYTKLIFTNK